MLGAIVSGYSPCYAVPHRLWDGHALGTAVAAGTAWHGRWPSVRRRERSLRGTEETMQPLATLPTCRLFSAAGVSSVRRGKRYGLLGAASDRAAAVLRGVPSCPIKKYETT